MIIMRQPGAMASHQKAVERPKAAQRAGLGDRVERLVKPIAKALRLPCLDEESKLRPGSPCAKRRDKLNDLGAKLGL